MRFSAWLLCAAGSLTCYPAISPAAPRVERPASVTEAQLSRQPSRLCPDDPRTPSRAEIRNTDKRTLEEILGVTRYAIVIQYRSPDWNGPEDIARRIREILEARPRILSPFINWAEGADLGRHSFVATVQMPDGVTARMDVAGYQVCVRDTKDQHWYFRHVPIDVWPSP